MPWLIAKKSVLLAAAFLLAGSILALVRHTQTTIVIPGELIRFSLLNDLEWDADTRLLRRTGSDPYGWFEIPPSAIPLDRVRFEFRGHYSEGLGQFYLFHSPAHISEHVLGEVELGQVTLTPDGLIVTGNLHASKALRLDVPDHLTDPLELRQMTLHAGFAGDRSWLFGLVVLCFAAGIASLAWPALRFALERIRYTEGAVIVILIGLKLGLATDLKLSLTTVYAHDDLLFVSLAASIIEGNWLGPFWQLTLAKGPVYPLFLSAVSLSGWELQLTQSVLHALASLALLLAIRPLLLSPALRLLLFGVVLFDPYTLSATAVGRVLRSGLHPALTLLTLAGIIGLAARATGRIRLSLPWALLAGIAGAAFWFNREEGIWLIPSVALLLAAAAFAILRAPLARKPLHLSVLFVPVLCLYSVTWVLRAVNHHHYGAFVSIDVKDGAFPRAYGALLRIRANEPTPGVPLPKENRLRAYAHSPAFAELQPMLEGAIGNGWAVMGWENIPPPPSGKDIRGGWLPWALRQSAEAAGHYKTAATAEEFWQRVADEINAACDRGEILARPPRHGFFPPWDSSLNTLLRSSLLSAAKVVLLFDDFYLQGPANSGSAEHIELFRRITHQPGFDRFEPPTILTQVRALLFKAYRIASFASLIIAPVALTALCVQAFRKRRHFLELAILFALAGGGFSLMLIVALVHTTSFYAVHAGYLSPATPLTLAFFVLAPAWACEARPLHQPPSSVAHRS